MSDALLAPWNELIHHLSHYNLHMHTFIRDTPLDVSSSPVSSKINQDILVGLMHQLSASLQGNSCEDAVDADSPHPTEPLQLLKSMCDSINSQLNGTMTIKDANVQSDVESFRCGSLGMELFVGIRRGGSAWDIFLQKLQNGEMNTIHHLILSCRVLVIC